MRPHRQLLLLPTLLLSAWLSTHAQQQEAVPDAPISKPYILHVYANLVQVPALALSLQFKPLPPIDRDRFSIRLDSGPAFHPTRMHLEGDEPLSIAILIDASGDQDRLLQTLPRSLAELAHTSLNPHDRVSIYANDCHLVRSALDLAPDPAPLEAAINNALASPTLHDGKPHGACSNTRHTWDAAAKAIEGLSGFPGRRVLLLVSSGYDHKSAYNPVTLRHLASRSSVAIFAVRDLVRFQGDFTSMFRPPLERIYLGLANAAEEPFVELCESTGGLILTLRQQDLTLGLQQFVALLRSRYILEFPRPDDHLAGEHNIDVTIPSAASFIVTAGVSVPLPDSAIEADPTTVHSNTPSPAILGKRHPVPHDK